MSSDAVTERWFQILIAVVMSAMGWLMWRTVAHDAQLQAMQYQISGILQSQNNVIPQVIEQSFKELREKGNSDRELMAKLSEAINANTRELGYQKEKFSEITKKP